MPKQTRISVWEDLRQTILIDTLIGLGLAFMQIVFRGWPRDLWVFVLANQVYAHSIGTIAAFFMPRVAMWVHPMPPLRRWSIYISTLVLGGLAGAAVGTFGVYLLGLIRPVQLRGQFVGSSLIAIIFTLVIGVASYLFESLKGRYEQTTLELRDKQLQHERALKLAAEAQFSSLQSRLQPHFLFNTINSVLALIREDPAAAEAMLQRLSRLLRFALDTQHRAAVPLREEIRLVSDYLEIEQARFGSRLQFDLQVDPALDEIEVPPFSIQTLVENAMKYAVATRREGGRIIVRAARDHARLSIEVLDDGPGFAPSGLKAGHGLDTLAQRLTSLHGDAGRLEILPATGGHVRFVVPVPLHAS
jgi:LytS/YehU family sensor histidine kinase